jgi:hypothetical protein
MFLTFDDLKAGKIRQMRKETLLYIALGVLIAVIVAGMMMWNKPHETVDDKAAMSISATKLTGDFEKDETAANSRYINKPLEVTGEISEVSKNQDGKTVLILASENPLSGVQATLRENGAVAAIGQKVTVKGFCNGFTTVVLLSDCILVNK